MYKTRICNGDMPDLKFKTLTLSVCIIVLYVEVMTAGVCGMCTDHHQPNALSDHHSTGLLLGGQQDTGARVRRACSNVRIPLAYRTVYNVLFIVWFTTTAVSTVLTSSP